MKCYRKYKGSIWEEYGNYEKYMGSIESVKKIGKFMGSTGSEYEG